MIQKLRTQFVCVIMSIVMLMTAVILGLVIYFTGQNMKEQSIDMMRSIADSPFHHRKLDGPPQEVRLPYFVVQTDQNGEVLNISGDFFDLTDEEYVRSIVSIVLEAEPKSDELKGHQLRYLRDRNRWGYTIVFSDITNEAATMRNLFSICLLFFLLAAGIFLGISILLSNWVIRPVAAAWEQQRQFVADASHELKTPLSVIMTNAELLSQENTKEEDSRKFSRNILSTSYQMRTLVENLLEMARVDNGAQEIHFTALDFSQLVNDAVLSFQLLYEEKELGLHCSIPEGITLQGSERHLYQVLDVLLDNALKYATPKGEVRVELMPAGHSCLLTVSNPGEPIEKEDLKNIFKRFYRADKARAMNGSYGLGLPIAEAILEAHKGKIWAESENGYNTFFVQLPLY